MSEQHSQDSETVVPVAGTIDPADWTRVVQQHVQSLRFGSVQVVVHDGRVVSVERIEKFRLPNRPA